MDHNYGATLAATTLHSAAKAGDLEVAELLLREGINVYCKDEQGLTPLHILLQKRIEMFDSLYTKGHKGFLDHAVSPNNSKTDMHAADSICKKIRENERFIDTLLKHKSSSFNCMPEVHLLNFHAACTLRNSSTAEQLSERLDVNQCVDASSPIYPGYSALHFAAHCNVNTVKVLVSKGGDLLIQDSKGVTPLQICIKSFNLEDVHSVLTGSPEWRYTLFSDGKTKLVDYIFSLCDAESHKNFLREKDNGITLSKHSLWPDYTILHIAVCLLLESNLQMIQDILNINPDIITMQGADGSTAVHLAFRQNKLKMVKLLLKHQKTAENPLDEDNLSVLHIAAAVDNQEIVVKILNNEENINVAYKVACKPLPTVKFGWTPLHTAIHTKHSMIARILLERGANFLQTDARGFTAVHELLGNDNMGDVAEFVFASDQLEERVVENVGLAHLHVAVWMNDAQAIEHLTDLGSDVEATIGKLEDEHLQRFEGCRPIHVATIDQTRPNAFETLLKRGADVFARRFDDPSPLIQVLNNELPQSYLEPLVELLWGNEKLQQRMQEETGVTMLHVLCYASDEEKIRELLQKGVDANARIGNDSSYWPGFTPLHVFVWRYKEGGRYRELCSLLLSAGANVASTDAKGNTPLLLLLKTWHIADVHEFASYLLKHQRDFSINHSNFDMSHFHVACWLNEVAIVKRFLKHNVVDVDQPISSADEFAGKTALLLALFFIPEDYEQAGLQIDTVNLLLERGADVDAVDAFGRTALHEVAGCSRTRIVLLHKLLSCSADINKRANDGKTPMEILLSDCATSKEVFYFLTQGARINSYNPISDVGYMAIFSRNYAAEPDGYSRDPIYEDILGFMMNSSDITEVSDTGRNAIHNAVASVNTDGKSCCRDYIKIIEKLMALGCHTNQQDIQGRTPLHLAVKFKHTQAVSALLSFGADVNIVDRRGNSPFAYAFKLHKNKSWNLDWRIDWDGENQDVGEILAVHLMKVQRVGLQLSDLNAKLLNKVLSKNDESYDDWDKRDFLSRLEKAKKVRMFQHGFTVLDFLHPTLVVNRYSFLKQDDRKAVDLFFKKHVDYATYEELESLLRWQYSNAQQRPSLIEPAVNALRQLLGFQLPDLCVDIVLMQLTNLDLKNMIAAASTDEREAVIVK